MTVSAFPAIETFRSAQGELLTLVIHRNFIGDKYNFLTDPTSGLQLGISNYKEGDEVRPHMHIERPKNVVQSQECIVVQVGRMELFVFDNDQKLVGRTVLGAGDVMFQSSGGHSFRMTEETRIVEVKQGPFSGDADKKIFQHPLP